MFMCPILNNLLHISVTAPCRNLINMLIYIINYNFLQVNELCYHVTKDETRWTPAPAGAKNDIWSFLATSKLRITCKPITEQEVSRFVFWEF
jgi:hypothetical protein